MTETKAVVLLATPITGPEAKVNRKSAVDILREQVVDLPNLTDRQIGETNRAVEAVAQKYAEKHKSDPPLEEQIEAGIAQMEKEIKKDEENIEKACKKIDNNLLKLKISKDKGEKLPALKDGTDSPQVKNRDSVKNLPLEDKKSGKKEKTPEQKLAEKKENLLLLKVAFTLAQSADSLKHLIGVEPLGRVNINLYKRGLDAVLNSFTTVFQGSKRINPATGVDEIAYFEHDIRTYWLKCKKRLLKTTFLPVVLLKSGCKISSMKKIISFLHTLSAARIVDLKVKRTAGGLAANAIGV